MIGQEQKEQRISRLPETVVNPQKNGHLPRFLRVPASILTLMSLGAVDQITSFVPTVEAADPNCRVGVRIESYLFFDMAQVLPEMGRRGILDMGIDPRAGSTAGFTVDAVPVSYKAGDREKPGYKPLASTTIVRDQENNVGRGELSFTAPCNTTTVTSEGKTVPAVKIKLTSNLEDNDQYEQVVGDGRRVPVFFGSEIKKLEDFLKIADEKPQIVKDLTPETKEKLRQTIREAVQKQEGEKKKAEVNSGIKEFPVIGGVVQAGEFALDLPAKALDQVTESDMEGATRTGVGIAGWLAALAALALLVNRPGQLRTRVGNAGAWPVRYPLYRRALARHNAQVAAAAAGVAGAVAPIGPAPTAPVRPFGV